VRLHLDGILLYNLTLLNCPVFASFIGSSCLVISYKIHRTTTLHLIHLTKPNNEIWSFLGGKYFLLPYAIVKPLAVGASHRRFGRTCCYRILKGGRIFGRSAKKIYLSLWRVLHNVWRHESSKQSQRCAFFKHWHFVIYYTVFTVSNISRAFRIKYKIKVKLFLCKHEGIQGVSLAPLIFSHGSRLRWRHTRSELSSIDS
jgi:hypothetical protein